MPTDVLSITVQPNMSNIAVFVEAAYRPVFFQVLATTVVTPDQPMWADIYMNGVYYKTISSYTINNPSGSGLYSFDLQDAYQEFLKTYLPDFPLVAITQTNSMPGSFAYQDVYTAVYFRAGYFDANGLLQSNGTVPVQATATTAAVSGWLANPSNTFSIDKISILPYFRLVGDINILLNPLESYMTTNKLSFTGLPANTRIYPQSNMPVNVYTVSSFNIGNPDLCPTVYRNDTGGFPILLMEYGVSGMLSRYARNCEVVVIFGDLTTFATNYPITSTAVLLTNGAFYIPSGLSDLFALQPLLIPLMLTADQDIYYRVALYDMDSTTYCFVSPMFKVGNGGIEITRLLFQNSYGHFEGISFNRYDEKHTTTSSDQFNPYQGVPLSVGRDTMTQFGHKRYNVRANDEITLTATFNEQLMPWVRELLDSPYVLQQMRYDNPSPNTFRGVSIIDGSLDIKKSVVKAGVKYTVSFKIRPSLDYITLRD